MPRTSVQMGLYINFTFLTLIYLQTFLQAVTKKHLLKMQL